MNSQLPSNEEWEAMNYMDELYIQWQGSQPTETDLIAAFPKEYEKWIPRRIEELREDDHRMKDMLADTDLQKYPHTVPFLQYYFDKNDEERQKLSRQLGWLKKPAKDRKELDIARAKQFPIPQLIELNRSRKAKCPWHPDKNPSMQYFPANNKVYCFSCNKHGDAIDVAQALWNIDFKEAVTRLTN